MKTIFCLALALVQTGSLASTLMAEEAVGIPSDIRAIFEANASALSPIEVNWKRSRSTEMKQDELMKMFNYPDYDKYGFFADTKFTIAWQDRMEYGLTEGFTVEIPSRKDEKIRIIPTGYERATNLENIYMGDDEKSRAATGNAPLLSIDSVKSPKRWKPDRGLVEADYLKYAGYWIPFLFRDLGKPAKQTALQLVAEGARVNPLRSVDFAGNQCSEIQLETDKAKVTLICDPKLGFAVRQQTLVNKESGRLVSVISLDDFVKAREPSLWLPKVCKAAYYAWPKPKSAGFAYSKSNDVPLFRETLNVTRIATTKIPIEHFMLKYTKPGTLVSDTTLPEAKNSSDGSTYYRVPADLSELPNVIAEANRHRFNTRFWLIALNIIVVVILIVVLVWRKRAST